MQKLKEYHFIEKIALLPFVDAIYLYGSRARGDARERSDIDLAIVCSCATDEDWHKVLSIVHNADTLLKIDCVWYDRLSKKNPLRLAIDKEKFVIYKKNDFIAPDSSRCIARSIFQ